MFSIFKKKIERSDTSTTTTPSITTAQLGKILKFTNIDPMRASTVYACVKVLGESVAMLPFKLYKYGIRKKDDGSTSTYPPRYEQWHHPLYNCLLVKPNPYMTAFAFKMFMMRNLVLSGDAYAYIVRDSQNRTVELWPLDKNCCVPNLLSNRSVVYNCTFYDGKYMANVPAKNIFHVILNPQDPFSLRGVNPIELQRKMLGVDDTALDALVRQYENGINSNVYINTPDNVWLEDKQFEALKAQIDKEYTGTANTGKPILLEGGMKMTPLGMSNRDAQFLELYQFTQEQICKMFRVPPHMIGDLRRATFSNIEHQSLEFLNYTLTPYLTAFEQAVWSDLLNEDEQRSMYADFDTTEFDRGDRASRYSAYSTGIQNGILSPNECRANEDLPPREGGDVYLTPLNMQPNSDTSEEKEEPKEKQPTEDNETEKVEDDATEED